MLAAYLTATLSGFLGMAGGISLLGVMAAVLSAEKVVPVHGMVQLASNCTRTLVFIKHVYWKIFWVFSLPAVAGTGLAALLWSGEKLAWFKPGIGVFIIVFLVWRRHAPRLRNVPLSWYAPLGFAAGFLSIFVGATGPFIAPFFLRDDFEKEQVIATKAVVQAWNHMLKIPAFFFLEFDYIGHAWLIAALLVCVILGTFTGKWVLKKMSQETFVASYEVTLALVGLYLILSPLRALWT